MMQTLCVIARSLGNDFAVFFAPVAAELRRVQIAHPLFDALIKPLRRPSAGAFEGRVPFELLDDEAGVDWTSQVPPGKGICSTASSGAEGDNSVLDKEEFDGDAGITANLSADDASIVLGISPCTPSARALTPSASQAATQPDHRSLRATWETTQHSTRADWHEWMRRLSVEMLRESPSPALRACAALAHLYQPLARELFNAAFLSCWTELAVEGYQDSLVAALETALDTDNMSLEVLQPLLNLAEFMELADKPLPIDIRKLAALAEKCHAYAKALHYREIEFETFPADTIEALISINNHLQQPEAAQGILTYAWQHYQVELKESWYEKLQRWADARDAYECKQQEDPDNLAWSLGLMRCHHALGDWETLSAMARSVWGSGRLQHDLGSRAEVSRLAAAAAWNLCRWDEMAEYSASMPDGTVETNLFRTVLAVHAEHFEAAQLYIDQARRQLDSEFTALVGESYHRAYRIMIEVMQLSELEEIIQHRERPAAVPISLLVSMWQERIAQVQRDADVWRDILAVRYLAVPPEKDPRTWLKYCSLCRKAGHCALSNQLLGHLLSANIALSLGGNGRASAEVDFGGIDPAIALAHLKQLWADGDRQKALERMLHFVHQPALAQDRRLAAKAWLKLGEWQRTLMESQGLDVHGVIVVEESFRQAAAANPESYKAWHAFAMINFDAVSLCQDPAYVVPAIGGFVRSIALGRDCALQDTLRLLTLWFKYGASTAVDDAVQQGFDAIPIDTWLLVTPQIIARIHTSTPLVRRSVHTLLNRVAKAHPQGLIYPLTVASKSLSQPQQSAAMRVLSEMRRQCEHLVEQAALVSVELIRTSILWHEMWHTALEEASRLYFGAQDVNGMLATLQPLNAMMQRGPETMRETSFLQTFGPELERAHEHCQRYQQTQSRAELHAVWDIYYSVFRRLTKQISKLVILELQHVSPKLLEAKDLELAVPGTYQAGSPIIRIGSFARSMSVIASKQRPRKLSISGCDGSLHAFLLKGHEDLRQDERVMQLFGLVNTLLATDRDTAKKDLAIQRYSVVPLSPNSGLISWVAQCDTLHSLIKEYREARKILLNVEHRIMLQMVPDYDALPVLNKLEVFQHTLTNSTGHDIARVLWLRSRNAEHWLLRRTTYTRSLAVMSMVGYILGLGDRHPSNLMLDRLTGKILHIDFGDCFEVAVHRDKFPEKIPFRLTRMLIDAMEVSGIEGNFRSTCEAVMSMLRNNKESVLAMLEAFVHDPLINWRLLVRPEATEELRDSGRVRSAPSVGLRIAMGTRRGSTSFGNMQGHASDTTAGCSRTMSSNPLPAALVDSWPRMDLAAGDTSEEWQHPASMMSTAHTPSGSGVPESSSVVSRRHVEHQHDEQALNDRAVSVLRRVRSKLAGSDFPDQAPRLDVATQVERLIFEAQSGLNLCQLYIGWCPFW